MIRLLARIAKSKKTPPAARASAAAMLLDRGYGRPPSFSTSDVGDFQRVQELSDQQLLDIALRAGIKLDPQPAHTAPGLVGVDVGTGSSPSPRPNDIN